MKQNKKSSNLCIKSGRSNKNKKPKKKSQKVSKLTQFKKVTLSTDSKSEKF